MHHKYEAIATVRLTMKRELVFLVDRSLNKVCTLSNRRDIGENVGVTATSGRLCRTAGI